MVSKKNEKAQHDATQDKEMILTREQILKVIELTEENSAARRLSCDYLKGFLESCGIDFDIDFSSLAGNYSSSNPKKSIIVPQDEDLVELYEKLPDTHWRNVYSLSLTYGLRNHENFYADRSPLTQGHDYIIVPEHTKTGFRICYPNYPEWIDEFNLRGAQFPEEIEEFRAWYEKSPQEASDSVAHEKQGTRVREALSLSKYIKGCRPYFLRYAWVRRSTLIRPMHEEEAARSLGHKVDVHRRIYRRWISIEDFHRSYEKFKNNPSHTVVPRRKVA